MVEEIETQSSIKSLIAITFLLFLFLFITSEEKSFTQWLQGFSGQIYFYLLLCSEYQIGQSINDVI